MRAKEHENGKMVILSNPFDTRAKILNGFYFIVFFCTGCFFLSWLLTEEWTTMMGIIITVVGTLVMLLAAYRFVNKSLLSEQLFVTKEQLQIINKGLFNKKGSHL
jgi:hypothetical protein